MTFPGHFGLISEIPFSIQIQKIFQTFLNENVQQEITLMKKQRDYDIDSIIFHRQILTNFSKHLFSQT
jgi:hypothetical protein